MSSASDTTPRPLGEINVREFGHHAFDTARAPGQCDQHPASRLRRLRIADYSLRRLTGSTSNNLPNRPRAGGSSRAATMAKKTLFTSVRTEAAIASNVV
ncbi:hypothetical protein Airi02_036200 [Actinoallomurus iriomotensis]|uniref:Uncharacterized protein n=1 Tax=Actinoallomurus iriomotensis TaxID=478107 RepID=A0A9W6RZJ1_9ACTN|nr:hypothetical protein Airi02_036200 [Actinoallomurus iriomotensis]